MARPPHSPKLGGWHLQTLIWSGLTLWLTGLAWLGLHYFGRTEGDFGPVIHPLEYVMLQLHGLFLIAILLALGGILFSHVGLGWRQVFKRSSGLTLLGTFVILTASGYGLYYSGDDIWREISTYSHYIVGIAAPLPFIWHLLVRIRRKQKKTSPTIVAHGTAPTTESGYRR